MDPKRPKIRSSRIWMKPTPLGSARRADSGGIFGFENGLCLRKISRPEVQVKQAKSQGQSKLVKGRTTEVADDISSTSH
jgi:hypothetical protein